MCDLLWLCYLQWARNSKILQEFFQSIIFSEGKNSTICQNNHFMITLETGIIVPRTFINFHSFSHPYAPYSRPCAYQIKVQRFKMLIFAIKGIQNCKFMAKSFNQYDYPRPYFYIFENFPTRTFISERKFIPVLRVESCAQP